MGIEVRARYALITDGPTFKPIDIGVFEPVPGEERLLKYVRNRTVVEVYEDLCKRLKDEGCFPDEYFGIMRDSRYSTNEEFPQYHWIACFPVTGASEGYYIHVEVINGNARRLLFLGKTLQDFDFAAKVAIACAKHLGA